MCLCTQSNNFHKPTAFIIRGQLAAEELVNTICATIVLSDTTHMPIASPTMNFIIAHATDLPRRTADIPGIVPHTAHCTPHPHLSLKAEFIHKSYMYPLWIYHAVENLGASKNTFSQSPLQYKRKKHPVHVGLVTLFPLPPTAGRLDRGLVAVDCRLAKLLCPPLKQFWCDWTFHPYLS